MELGCIQPINERSYACLFMKGDVRYRRYWCRWISEWNLRHEPHGARLRSSCWVRISG